MWNPLKRVAENQFLEAEPFIAFAKQNAAKFGLDTEGVESNPWVSNWHVDDLIKAYKAAMGKKEINRQRNLCIRRMLSLYSKISSEIRSQKSS